MTITITIPVMVLNIACFFAGLQMALDGFVDFRHLYTAGYMVRTGHGSQLHDYQSIRQTQDRIVGPANGATLPFNHLAYEALLFAPLSLATYRAAYWIFLAVNLFLLWLSFWMLRDRFGHLGMPGWFAVVLCFAFLPVVFGLSEGHDSLILFVLMTAAAMFYDRGLELESGALIGLSVFKFQFGIPIVLLFLFWKRWRLAASFAGTAAVMVALSLLVTGVQGFRLFLQQMTSLSVGLSNATQAQFSLYPTMMVNLRGLFYGVARGVSPHAIQILVAAVSIAVFCLAMRQRPSFSLAVTTAVLVSYHCFAYDAILLLIPMSVLIGQVLRGTAGMWTAVLVAVLIASPTAMMYAGNKFYLLAIAILGLFVVLLQRPSAGLASDCDQGIISPAATAGV